MSVPFVESAIGKDGLCNLFTFAPFTIGEFFETSCLDTENACINPGFTQMASSLLATQVFNTRNASIVPELALPVFQDCHIQLDTNNTNSLVFNTATLGHAASKQLLQNSASLNSFPCAVAGPFHDMPAQELSVLAAAAEFPVVVHRAFNLRVVSDTFSPFTSQVFPDLITSSHVLTEFLQHKGRTDYIAVLYALTDTGSQRSVAFRQSLGAARMRHATVSFMSPAIDLNSVSVSDELLFNATRLALQQVKLSGFRTIVLAMEVPFLELPLIADAAAAMGLLNQEYFWVLSGHVDPKLLFTNNTNVTGLLKGAAWLSPVELHYTEPDTNKFLQAWRSANETLVHEVNEANPMKEGQPGYFFANQDFYQTYLPEYGDGFMFDAVMATAMGACLAAADNTATTSNNNNGGHGGPISSEAHVRGIRSVDFEGATGRVKFGATADSDGARLASTVTWSVFNLVPSLNKPVVVSELYLNGTWTHRTDFVYADGTTVPPKLLRDEPEQNYLNNVIRGVGLALMGVVMFMAVATVVWVYLHRNHRVLQAAQPHFLYLLAIGSAVSVSTVIPISFDESTGLSQQELDRMCMAIPWLLSLGHIITYGALFTKMWRINKVLQFSRRKIEVKQVAWPSTVLTVLALFVLSLWTGLDSFKWEREEINDVTGESISQCQSQHWGSFLSPLVVLMIIPTIMTGVMAWKTKDVDDAYSESQWISTMIIVQVEVIVVAVPTMTILRDESSDGRYLGFMFLILTFPMSALGFIILPKVFAYYEAIRARSSDARPKLKRGDTRGNVRISGLPASPYTMDSNMRVAADVGSGSPNAVTGTPQGNSTRIVDNDPTSESCTTGSAEVGMAIDCPSPPQPEQSSEKNITSSSEITESPPPASF
jgi:hypothetical protein